MPFPVSWASPLPKGRQTQNWAYLSPLVSVSVFREHPFLLKSLAGTRPWPEAASEDADSPLLQLREGPQAEPSSEAVPGEQNSTPPESCQKCFRSLSKSLSC